LGIPFPQITNRAAYGAISQTASNVLLLNTPALNAMTTSGCHLGHVIAILPIVDHVTIKNLQLLQFRKFGLQRNQVLNCLYFQL
jgi:hypothetical protein